MRGSLINSETGIACHVGPKVCFKAQFPLRGQFHLKTFAAFGHLEQSPISAEASQRDLQPILAYGNVRYAEAPPRAGHNFVVRTAVCRVAHGNHCALKKNRKLRVSVFDRSAYRHGRHLLDLHKGEIVVVFVTIPLGVQTKVTAIGPIGKARVRQSDGDGLPSLSIRLRNGRTNLPTVVLAVIIYAPAAGAEVEISDCHVDYPYLIEKIIIIYVEKEEKIPYGPIAAPAIFSRKHADGGNALAYI